MLLNHGRFFQIVEGLYVEAKNFGFIHNLYNHLLMKVQILIISALNCMFRIKSGWKDVQNQFTFLEAFEFQFMINEELWSIPCLYLKVPSFSIHPFAVTGKLSCPGGIFIHLSIHILREAFQSKNQWNLGISPNRGGVVKKSKKSQVSEGNKD